MEAKAGHFLGMSLTHIRRQRESSHPWKISPTLIHNRNQGIQMKPVIMIAMNILYKSLYGHIFSFLLGIHLWMEVLDHIVTPCLPLEEMANFSKVAALFYFPISSVCGFQFVCILTNTYYCLWVFFFNFILLVSSYCLFLIPISEGGKWYLIMILICISLMTDNV